MAAAPFGKAGALHRTFSRISACDPLQRRTRAHMMQARLWQGDFAGALADGERMRDMAATISAPGMRSFAMTLALNDRPEEARQAARTRPRTESERLISRFSIAALEGDAEAAASMQQDYLHAFGPDDGWSLVMEAQRGNRNEADRLARIMDARPFGYVSLLQSVFRCYCGAPFDLDATPDFAARLAGSGVLASMPPVLAFSSLVDATVRAPELAARLFNPLPPGGHELVLFDLNRRAGMESLLKWRPDEWIAAIGEGIDVTQCQGNENCQDGERCLTHELWTKLGQEIYDFLNDITLASFIKRDKVTEVIRRQQARVSVSALRLKETVA